MHPTDNGHFNLLWGAMRQREAPASVEPTTETLADVRERIEAEVEALRGVLAAEAAMVVRDERDA